MARHLSIASVIERNRIESATAFVILIEIDVVDPNTRQTVENIYLARNSENVVFNEQLYIAANFTIQVEQNTGEEPTVTLTAIDPTRTVSSRLEAYAGGMYSNVTMTVVNTARLDLPPELQETFSVTGAQSEESSYTTTINLGSENPFQIRYPLHMQFRDRCCWRFKSKQCGYTGDIVKCDYSLDGTFGCSSKGNQLNFGGIPGLVVMGG